MGKLKDLNGDGVINFLDYGLGLFSFMLSNIPGISSNPTWETSGGQSARFNAFAYVSIASDGTVTLTGYNNSGSPTGPISWIGSNTSDIMFRPSSFSVMIFGLGGDDRHTFL
jgi:hypothetical protein